MIPKSPHYIIDTCVTYMYILDCIISIFTLRFATRPAPASPEKQVLVRQEESSATAINSEIFYSILVQACILPTFALLSGVRGSPKVAKGSVQESQPVFVLRPFIVSLNL